MSYTSFNALIQSLGLPASGAINKTIYKKMFLDSGALNAADKRILKEDVTKISWLYTLKPSTINIAPHKDQEREYLEIAILHIELSESAKYKRIAQFVNHAIPYPLVLFFTCNSESAQSVLLTLVDKRTNQADSKKWVIEESLHSGWINLADQNAEEKAFLESLRIDKLPFKNFWEFYRALMSRIVAINCAKHSGSYKLYDELEKESGNARLEKLRELEKLGIQKTEITNKLKKEKQMGKQIHLNSKVKEIRDAIYVLQREL